jgi:hypothetical protein
VSQRRRTRAHDLQIDCYALRVQTGACERLRDPHQVLHSPEEYIEGLRHERLWKSTKITRDPNGEIETVDVYERGREGMRVRFFASRDYCETERADLIENGQMQKSPNELK